ncbi:MAG: cytochrome P450 [Candidatus Tectomicrobia bacterium]|nr:cytochrome P450 [Candidatus Tectomicrobia bacterium]
MSIRRFPTASPSLKRRAPGPRGLAAFAALLRFKRQGVVFLEQAVRDYGDVVSLHCLGFKVHIISRPDLIHHILTDPHDNYVKAQGNRRTQRFFGHAMQTSNGDFARRQRRLMAAAFHRDHVRVYAQRVVLATLNMCQSWVVGEQRNVSQEIMDLALNLGIQMLFGTAPGEASARIAQSFTTVIRLMDSFLKPPAWLPTPRNRRYIKAMAQLDADVTRLIQTRRRQPQDSNDVLSCLIAATDRDGHGMSDQQIRDELVSMLAAGYHTVAVALIQTFRLLAEHDEADARLAAELHQVLGDRPPTADDLDHLLFTVQVIKETLRLCPPAGVIARRVVAEDDLGGWRIPARSMVFISQWIMHHRSQFYDAPEVFRPERWSPEFERALPTFAYFPFGWGPRGCIAQALAMMELQLIVATVAQRFRMELPQRSPSTQMWDTIRDEGGLTVRLHDRLGVPEMQTGH